MATELSLSSESASSILATPATAAPLTFPVVQHLLSIKLTCSNSLIWRKQIIPFLKGQGLFGYFDGTHKIPDDPTAASAWQRQDAQLVSLLVASLSEDLVPLLLDKETSRECWTTLTEAYGSASSTRLIALSMEIQGLCQKPEEDVTSLLWHAKSIADELSASGNPLKPMEFWFTVRAYPITPEYSRYIWLSKDSDSSHFGKRSSATKSPPRIARVLITVNLFYIYPCLALQDLPRFT